MFFRTRSDFIVKVTSRCNIRCKYCYHFSSPRIEINKDMPKDVASDLIKESINYNKIETNFIWHGGEPLLMGKKYFEFLINEQKIHNIHKKLLIRNSIQTNGLLLNDDWINFFINNDFHIGISLDGYFENHIQNRNITQEDFFKILSNINKLQEKNAKFGILCVVSQNLVGNEKKLIDFFFENKIYNIGFLPKVIANDANINKDESISPVEYGYFLCNFFDLWINSNNTKLVIREFDEYFRSKLGIYNKLCTNSNNCINYMTILPSGEVFLCDCFEQNSKNKVGHISEGLYTLRKARSLHNLKKFSSFVPQQCIQCEYHKICNGGCKYFRLLSDKEYSMPHFYCQSFYNLYKMIDKYFSN